MMLLLHRLRGHRIEPFRVNDRAHPWRWQCSCGLIFGGGKPFRRPIPTGESIFEIEKVATDIVNVVREHTPDE